MFRRKKKKLKHQRKPKTTQNPRKKISIRGWLIITIFALSFWVVLEMLTPYQPLSLRENKGSGRLKFSFYNFPSAEPFSKYDKLIKSRILFKPSQRPKRTGGIARIGVEEMAKKLKLKGIVSLPGKCRALISIGGKSPSLYSEGDTMADFTIKKITRKKVIIEYAEQEILLTR